MHLRTLLNTIFILMIINLNTAIGELRKFESEFALDGVERIEVLRGPASFLYGTNATGGV